MTTTMLRRDDLIRMVDLPTAKVELRATNDGLGTLTGYAAVFNSDTTIDSWEGRFIERIAPGAFARSLKQRGDQVKVLFNHGFDPSVGDKPLGKPRVMREDSRGLYVEVPLDDTSYNRDLAASLRSGALDGMSFRFSVRREEVDETGDLPVRTLQEVILYEFGPVTFPAYEATSAGIRAREGYQAWRQVVSSGGTPERVSLDGGSHDGQYFIASEPSSDVDITEPVDADTSGDVNDSPPILAPVGVREKWLRKADGMDRLIAPSLRRNSD